MLKGIIQEYETSKTLEQFNLYMNHYKYETHFKPLDYNNVFKYYGYHLDEVKKKVLELVNESDFYRNVIDSEDDGNGGTIELSEFKNIFTKDEIRHLDRAFQYMLKKQIHDARIAMEINDSLQ